MRPAFRSEEYLCKLLKSAAFATRARQHCLPARNFFSPVTSSVFTARETDHGFRKRCFTLAAGHSAANRAAARPVLASLTKRSIGLSQVVVSLRVALSQSAHKYYRPRCPRNDWQWLGLVRKVIRQRNRAPMLEGKLTEAITDELQRQAANNPPVAARPTSTCSRPCLMP